MGKLRIGEALHRSQISGRPVTSEALNVVLSVRSRQMGYQGVDRPLFARRGCVLVGIKIRLSIAGMFVPNPVQLRNKLRSDWHVAELIEEQILHANKDNVVVGKLLPRKLAGSNNRERALRCLQQANDKAGSIGLSESCVIAARVHL